MDLSESVTQYHPSFYYKGQDEEVTVYIAAKNRQNQLENLLVLGYLPEGFRPGTNIEVPACVGKQLGSTDVASNERFMGSMVIAPDGHIRLSHKVENAYVTFAEFRFIAAQ